VFLVAAAQFDSKIKKKEMVLPKLQMRLTPLERFVLHALKFQFYVGLKFVKLDKLMFKINKRAYDLFLDYRRDAKGPYFKNKKRARIFFFKVLERPRGNIVELWTEHNSNYRLFQFCLSGSRKRQLIRWLSQR
jgi:hypothetical protein